MEFVPEQGLALCRVEGTLFENHHELHRVRGQGVSETMPALRHGRQTCSIGVTHGL